MGTAAPKAWLVGLGLFAVGCAGEATDPPATDAVSQLETPADQPVVGDEPMVAVAADEVPGDLETLAACSSSPASFQVTPSSTVGGPLVGFGAQFNANLFHPSGRFNQSKLGQVATLVRELRPQHVRIFFDARAFRDPTRMTSFSRTVALAQSAGASINVTYWHGPYSGAEGSAAFGKAEMDRFADVLKREIGGAGHTAIKYVTVQNEPNRTKFNSHKKDLATVYKNLDAALRARGIRSSVKLVFENTRGYQGTKSWHIDWLKIMAAEAGDVLDGYAWHIYWDHDMADKFRDGRLTEIRNAVASLPAAQRKPIYVTEFGTRGEADTNKSVLAWPGWLTEKCTAGKSGCRRMLDSTEAGVNNAFFQIAGARAGFRAFVYWDAYWTMYDKTEQHWSMIGKPSDGLLRRPTYYAQKLFSHVVPVGWTTVAVSNPGRQHLRATAFRGDGELTVLGVNKSRCATTFRYSGLPSQRMYELVWNDNGDGKICSRGLTSAKGGALNIEVHARSVVALTTRPSGLKVPTCDIDLHSYDPPTCGDGECTEGETDETCGQDCGCGAADACGSVAPFGCFCDPDCEASGDCCADVGVCR